MRGRNWCFRISNPTEDPEPIGWPHFRACVFQHEIGELTGTAHIQGYIEFTESMRQGAVIALFERGTEVQLRMGSKKQATDYCCKDETRDPADDGPFWIPDEDTMRNGQEPGKRNDIHAATEDIKAQKSFLDIAEEHSVVWVKYYRGLTNLKTTLQLDTTQREDVTSIYICGPPGTGKTHYCKEHYPEGPDTYWKSPGKWWDGYHGQGTVVFNDFDDSWFQLRDLKLYVDDGACQVERKGATMWLLATVMVFTSNRHPKNLYRKKLKGTNWSEGSNPLYRRFPLIRLFLEVYEAPDAIDRIDEAADWDDGYENDAPYVDLVLPFN